MDFKKMIEDEAEKKYPRTFYDGTLTLDDKNYEIKRNAFIAGATFGMGLKDEWISVDERLPEKYQWCFVYTTDCPGISPIDVFQYHAIDSGRWPHVTHWQNLPSPPKSKEA